MGKRHLHLSLWTGAAAVLSLPPCIRGYRYSASPVERERRARHCGAAAPGRRSWPAAWMLDVPKFVRHRASLSGTGANCAPVHLVPESAAILHARRDVDAFACCNAARGPAGPDGPWGGCPADCDLLHARWVASMPLTPVHFFPRYRTAWPSLASVDQMLRNCAENFRDRVCATVSGRCMRRRVRHPKACDARKVASPSRRRETIFLYCGSHHQVLEELGQIILF